jgi:hypothetical protein
MGQVSLNTAGSYTRSTRISAVASAAHTFSGGCAIGTVRSMR